MKKRFRYISSVLAVLVIGNSCFGQEMGIKRDSALTVSFGNKKLLTYQFKTVYPPKGIDTNYKRSGFIHPLYALKLSPHEQLVAAFGFLTLKPPSCKAST